MDVDIAQYRDRFPIFKNVTYLNSCSQGALADTVRLSARTGQSESVEAMLQSFGVDPYEM